MSRVISEAGIANRVASILKSSGVSGINPAEPGSKLSAKISVFYDDVRREVLRDHIWNFAETEASLAADGAVPLGRFERRFLLPDDYIRLVWLADEMHPERDYKIKGKYLYCNEGSPVSIGYIFDQNDISTFDSHFLNCFTIKLAHAVSYDMTGNASYREALANDYTNALATASSIDGQESPPTHRIRRSKWRDAKYHRGGHGLYYQGRVVT